MKKLNLKTFFKKFNNTIALNRLPHCVPNFPAIDKVQDPKDRAKALMEHLEILSPENKIALMTDLKKIYHYYDKETVKIIKKLLQNKIKYIFSTEDQAYITASENDIDLIINIYVSKQEMLEEANIISSFYKKKSSIYYDATSDNTIIRSESDEENELLAIELSQALKETLNDNTEIVEHAFKIFKYENIDFLYIQNSKNEKEDICVAFIKEISIIMISAKGNKEKLFTIVECYARIVFGININPLVLAYDLSAFKIKNANSKSGNHSLYPLINSNNLKNWKIKNIELTNIISLDILSLKLKTNLEHNGMSQMWSFLEMLGDIKNLLGYSTNKISMLIEINDTYTEKGFEKVNLNLSEKTSSLNLLYPSHRKIYKILLDAQICIGFVEEK